MAHDNTTDKETGKETPQSAILFELENIAVNGRQIIYDVLKSVLDGKSIELTPAVFSRYCLRPSVNDYLPDLLASKKKSQLSENKLIAEISSGIKLSFTDSAVKVEKKLGKILKLASQQNILMGALSGLDEEVARQMADNLGLTNKGVCLLSCPSGDKNYPAADTWLKLAKEMSVLPTLCVALVTNSISCKAALSAGMQCVVIPDKFTSHQDFGGSDYVIDQFDDNTVDKIFELLSDN
ncbi:hypothetical protein ACFLS1_05000 [Verrucomicrobiota bacterium]